MQVAKCGNSRTVRLPAAVVEALTLKEGDEIEIHVAGARVFEVNKRPEARELLARLRKFCGRLPAEFKFDRLEANERGRGLERAGTQRVRVSRLVQTRYVDRRNPRGAGGDPGCVHDRTNREGDS